MSLSIDTAIICAVIAAIASIMTASMQLYEKERRKKRDEREQQLRAEKEKQEKERRYMELATYKGVRASLEALDVTLIAVEGGKINGNVESAHEKVKDALDVFSETSDKVIASYV